MALFFNFGFEYTCFSEKQTSAIISYLKNGLEMTAADFLSPPPRLTVTYGVADKTKRIRASLLSWLDTYSGAVFEDTEDFTDMEIAISFDNILFRAKAVKCKSTGALAEIEFPDGVPDDRYSWDWYEQLAYQAGILLTEKELVEAFAERTFEEKDGFNVFGNEREVISKIQSEITVG